MNKLTILALFAMVYLSAANLISSTSAPPAQTSTGNPSQGKQFFN